MAFKATRKPSTRKIKSDTHVPPAEEKNAPVLSESQLIDQPAVVVSTEQESSVDDFIGGPVQTAVPQETEPQPVAPPQSLPRETLNDRQDRYEAPNRQEYSPRYQQNYQGGGYGGGYRQRFNGNTYRSRPPMRRDFGPTDNGNIDINVPTETIKGLLTIMPEGHGFLRPKFTPSDRDVYISQSQIRRFLLRNGDMVQGQARSPKENERYWGLLKVEMINDQTAELMKERPRFDDLTAIYPNKLLRLETGISPLSTRIIDLIAPIGFGQRGMIVSPPKAGKTTIMKELAAGITENFPEVHLMAALIGERPEEVTDISRSVKGEVLSSNFDESPQEQTRVAEVALDRAKRLVEMGKDVVILLDSITRLARAYNLVVNPSGRTLSGGFDPAALYPAKKFLGAARCVEAPVGADGQPIGKGGSLTVIGTALVDTGSRMDDMIYEEFKGTGNMELHLSRFLQERRIFPAIDIGKSGTRHDELLLGEANIQKVTTLRHMLTLLSDEERTTMLIERLKKSESNQQFLDALGVGV
jgi:transcription termination factor Rho